MQIHRFKEHFAGYMFILPSLIGFTAFMLYPIIYSIFLSLMDWNMYQGFGGSTFIGFDNYLEVFKNEYFMGGLINNIKLLVFAVPILLMLALTLAHLLNSHVFGKGALRTVYFLPYITTITATAIVFAALFHEELGPVNGFLRAFGIENVPRWLGSVEWSLPTISIFWIWRNLGYCILIFLAGLQAISPSYYEAAEIDGASGIQKFFRITMPLVSPITFFLAVTMAIFSFSMFAEVKVMTEGGPGTSSYTIVYHIYKEAFERYDMGYASAASILFFIIILAITTIQWLGQKKWVNY